MKKIIIFLISALAVCAFAKSNDLPIEQKIINKITHALYPNKQIVLVYYYGKQLPLSIKTDPDLDITNNPDKADVIILGDDGWKGKEREDKPIIVLEYSLLKKYPMAIGAYYWQKGRPNIVMLSPRLRRMHIKLPKEFERYTESKVW